MIISIIVMEIMISIAYTNQQSVIIDNDNDNNKNNENKRKLNQEVVINKINMKENKIITITKNAHQILFLQIITILLRIGAGSECMLNHLCLGCSG